MTVPKLGMQSNPHFRQGFRAFFTHIAGIFSLQTIIINPNSIRCELNVLKVGTSLLTRYPNLGHFYVPDLGTTPQ